MNKKCSKQKRNFINTYLSHILISIVALIECLILLTFTTFSWIESSSSLEIYGDNLGIANNMYFQIENDTTGEVDLNAFFRQTSNFRYSMVSSANGKTFFMPKINKTQEERVGTYSYRKADTTDYNTSYRAVDFKFHNTTSSPVYYGFDNDNPFTSDIEDQDLKKLVESAFLFSVDVNGSSSPVIYANSNSTISYSGITNTSGSYTTFTPKKITKLSGTTGTRAFQVAKNTTTSVTVRVWLEERVLINAGLSEEQKATILSSQITLNLKFVKFTGKPESIYTPIFLNDPIGLFDHNSSINLKDVTEDNTTKTYTLSWVSDNNRYEYNGSGGSVTGLDLDNASLDSAYFYQKIGTNAAKYSYCNSTPQTDESGVEFTLLNSVATSSSYYSIGTWDESSKEVFFNPQNLTYYSSSDYNDQSSGISNRIPMNDVKIYCTTGGSYPLRQIALLTYNSSTQKWSGTVPNYFVNNTLYFYYCPGNNVFSTSGAVVIDAPSPTMYNGVYEFKPLGYTDTNNKEGVGTWGDTKTIDISSELIESEIAPTDRYKVSAMFGNTRYSYYMQPHADHICHFAYVPESAGSSDTNLIGFTKIVSGGTIQFTPSKSDDLTKYYIAKDADNNTYEGGWNLAVIVDGTAEHLIYGLMHEENNTSSLKYTHNGTEWYNFTRLDDYRWYTVLNNNITQLPVRWTAYANTGTYFDYTFRTIVPDQNPNDVGGIYMTIVEK